MADNRATKSGFALEAQKKMMGKYDKDQAHQCLEWISSKIGERFDTSGDMDNFHTQLVDGVKLCKLVNSCGGNIPPGKFAKAPTMAFKRMELIGMAVSEMIKMGLNADETFQTVDLYERQNLSPVVTAIEALGRKKRELGPKEATQNKRHFTDEQMKAGQGVIGLQMGTNKGASQSGMNIGKSRHIMD